MAQIEDLLDWLLARSSGGVALAFSGGVDSTLLLELLCRARHKRDFLLLAMTMRSLFQKSEEFDAAKRAAERAGVRFEAFECDPLAIPEVKRNAPDRCYHCKREIFRQFRAAADAAGIALLVDGTNADDLAEYRPGLRALRELGVHSPLAELGIGKREVRRLAAELNLECASRPSAPCLATRFEYGTLLDAGLVDRVAAGEALIRELLPGAEPMRLRVHGRLARIELPVRALSEAAALREKLVSGLKELGFDYVTVDLEGFRSGSMDLNLSKEG